MELYAVWAAKPFLLAEALRRLKTGEELGSLRMTGSDDIQYSFDVGSFRGKHVYSSCPDLARTDEGWKDGEVLGGMKKNELAFFPIQRLPDYTMQLWMEHLGPVDNHVSEGMVWYVGSFFGSHLTVADWWERYYYAYHDHYLAQHIFVGKDQTLINALFLLRPSHFISVWHGDPDAPAARFRPATFSSVDTEFVLGGCGDEWYYYQFFLASAEERD